MGARDLIGIGLRAPHAAAIESAPPPVGWLEAHPENYMTDGPARAELRRIRAHRPVALHGVGLSLGGARPLDREHLRRFRDLIDEVEPCLVSEHLAWCGDGGYLNDLLPLPYTDEALDVVCDHVAQAQDAIRRRILIENPSTYLRFVGSMIPEPEFLSALARRTGCGLLCDVNNIHVSANNLGFDPAAYLDALPRAAIGEIHLAGHAVEDIAGAPFLIDTHGDHVATPVWRLYEHALALFGPVATLIEWDNHLPALDVLVAEAHRAEAILEDQVHAPV